MLVREYREGDLDALRSIHAAQGFDYALPDLRNPLFVTKLVLSDVTVAPGFSPASSLANVATRDATLKGDVGRDAIQVGLENAEASKAGN